VRSKMLLPTLAMFRNRRLFLRFVAAGLCLGSLLFWTFSPTSASSNLPLAAGGTSTPRGLPCHDLPGGQETLFILRTGATEIADRLPAHIATSLRCFQNHIVFSDFEERFQDENVLDALESVDPQIIANNQGFELYRRLQRDGRAGLSPSELSGNEAQALSDSGHSEIPGWKLDKWKFVPMVNRTLFEYPDMNWYVFMEADSFILWSTLQLYLSKMDPTKPHYLGVDTYIGDDPAFAHGGAGFMVSRPAMRMVVDYYAEHKAEIEARTDSHWAGDAVLGITFKNAGVPLTSVWPLVHGESTGHAFFARSGSPGVPKEYKQVWCYPAGTYHHMSSAAVDSLWHFEQKWLEQREKVRFRQIPRFHLIHSINYLSDTLFSTGHGRPPSQRYFQALRDAADVRRTDELGQSQRWKGDRSQLAWRVPSCMREGLNVQAVLIRPGWQMHDSCQPEVRDSLKRHYIRLDGGSRCGFRERYGTLRERRVRFSSRRCMSELAKDWRAGCN